MTSKTHVYDPKLNSQELHATISQLGIKKANTHVWEIFLLGALAGLYISIGGHLYLVALANGAGKIMASGLFSLGLVLVIVVGAELFTGNIIMIIGFMSGLYKARNLLKNWVTVYLGNFIGSVLFALIIFKSGLFGTVLEGNALGELAAAVAEKKMALSFTEAFIRGFFCNVLVILAIIMSVISKDITSKILACIFPVLAFVAMGFEHCVANMFLIPIGLLAKGASPVELLVMFKNIGPVTLGNILGGLFILVIHPNRIRQLKVLHKKITTVK
jgi:formate/nitrite transporter